LLAPLKILVPIFLPEFSSYPPIVPTAGMTCVVTGDSYLFSSVYFS
jgi:hypothetical protein